MLCKHGCGKDAVYKDRCDKSSNKCPAIRIKNAEGLIRARLEGRYKGNQGHRGWNKGLTKETDERVKRTAEKISKFQKENSTWKGRHHSEETKKKLSELRIKFLEENPDKVPYLLNHSSKQSWPEKIFQNALTENDIKGWVPDFRCGIYEYDFAFPELKIDLEIDRETHQQEKVKKIDERRDKWTKNNGWTIIRYSAKDVRKDIDRCIKSLQEKLTGY